jgi:hypothetical protein
MTVSCDDLSTDCPLDDLSDNLSNNLSNDLTDEPMLKGSVPALLALKRFVRKTLRHLGWALASIMMIWGLNAHGAASTDSSQVQGVYKGVYNSSSSAHLLTTEGTPNSLQPSLSQPLTKPFQLLTPRMTQHRLTGARLSIPSTIEQTVASLSEPSLSETN